MLRKQLEPGVKISFIRKMPDSFEEQVSLFNKADLHITPHGGSGANTLFMKKNSAIIEIQSRHCMARNETNKLSFSDAAMRADENTWTAWHAGYMDLHLMPAPCVRDYSNDIAHANLYANFTTDNPSILKLTAMVRETQRIFWEKIKQK